MGLDPRLLEKLVCPKCHGPLKIYGEEAGLDCEACGLRYPVETYGEGVSVPDMIIEHAADIRSADGKGG